MKKQFVTWKLIKNRAVNFYRLDNKKEHANLLQGTYLVIHTPGNYTKEELTDFANCMEDLKNWDANDIVKRVSVKTYRNEESKQTIDIAWDIIVHADDIHLLK